MSAYYNEIEPYAAQWLRNLIAAGHIAPGDVDERDIRDVRPSDLTGYTQCHFFAGIGGWSYALRLAGWPDSRSVWTGSCPCQPFSTAGKRKGFDDERHLWPAWFSLIRECRPAVVFGEQVARAADWLRLVRSDLEALEYAVGTMPIEAASVGANHRRDRFWFVADADKPSPGEERPKRSREQRRVSCDPQAHIGRDVADAGGAELRQQPGRRDGANRSGSSISQHAGWWLVEPAVGRVAHGVPNRVGRLRAYGNAIVPQVAAEFIRAYSVERWERNEA